jgi:hypothetical protein
MGQSPRVGSLLRLLEHVSIQSSEELILNTISLVTNLTYYATSSSVRRVCVCVRVRVCVCLSACLSVYV